jgi:monoamine oxidase
MDFKDAKNPDEIDASERSDAPSEGYIPLDRRAFGKLLAAGVGGLALGISGCTTQGSGECAFEQAGPEPHQLSEGNSPDVIVIGAGLSGLIAARRLLQRTGERRECAKSVILLEAENYVGGRMSLECTADGYALDMGGQWVGETQRDMQALVDELKICHFTSYESGWSIEQWKGDRRGFNGSIADLLEGKCADPHLPSPQPAKCKPAPFPHCENNGDDAVMGAVWKKLLAISDGIKPEAPWDYVDAKTLDSKTFATWLKDELKLSGAKDPAKAYTEFLSTVQARIGGSGGFEPEEVSMLHMAWSQRVGRQAEIPEEWLLKGGAGQIPAILRVEIEGLTRTLSRQVGQSTIREPFRLGEAVISVVMTKAGYFEVKTRQTSALKAACPPSEILADKEAATKTYWCREVIVAIPPPLRQRIDFRWESPIFKDQIDIHKKFSTHSNMGSISKVHLVYETPFWRDLCLSGSVVGDKPYCEFFADSSLPTAPNGSLPRPGILTAFIAGNRNKDIEGWTKEQVRDVVIGEVWDYFGKNDDFKNVKGFHYRNWNTRKWACGAFTSYEPIGTWTDSGKTGWREPIGVKATGRIHFAGTESSDRWPGYYDGAVRAGKRAAAAILGVDAGLYDPGHDSSFAKKWDHDSDLGKCETKVCG